MKVGFDNIKVEMQAIKKDVTYIDSGCLSNEIGLAKANDKFKAMYEDLKSHLYGQKYDIPIIRHEHKSDSPILMEKDNKLQLKRQENNLEPNTTPQIPGV